MLKIKNNVDLKELEKYGFIKNECVDYEIYFYTIDSEGNDMDCCILVNDIDNNDRIIRFMYYNSCDFSEGDENIINYDCIIPDVIFDLIKADLVEKVGE